MSSNPITLTTIDGEPRIHDLQLAERLGFSQTLDIRKLIKRNEAKLLKFGVLATVAKTSSELGGRPTVEFYPNQKQSVWLCMKSETEKAFDVQVEIVRVFDAYLTGDLKPNIPNFANPADAARAWALEYERAEAEKLEKLEAYRQIEVAQPKIAFHDQVVVSENLLDFTEAFSLLQRKTGQHFTKSAFLEFGRRHAFACQPNPHTGVTKNRFVPRKDFIGEWFVLELHQNGVAEWKIRPMAIAGIVALILGDQRRSAFHGYEHQLSIHTRQEAA